MLFRCGVVEVNYTCVIQTCIWKIFNIVVPLKYVYLLKIFIDSFHRWIKAADFISAL